MQCPSADTCQKPAPPARSIEVEHAAQELACLLADTEDFQAFVRLVHDVRQDSDAANILRQIHSGVGFDDTAGEALSIEELYARLEAVPVMKAYRQAEQVIMNLFHEVDLAIGGAAGVPFAENAKASACG
jgi:cell fate (sporulation/competence/biofilm development) regulator YlbF (YheA/YmcA/DUF963 family)